MNPRLFLILACTLCLIGSATAARGQNHKKAASDDDEFGEFDDFDEADTPKKPAKAAAKPEPVKKDDFSNFDDTIIEEDYDEDTNSDEEFENTKQKKPDKAASQSASEKSVPPKNSDASSSSSSSSFNSASSLSDDLDTEEFEHFVDDRDFDELESAPKTPKSKEDKAKHSGGDSKASNQMPSLKIADVPKHLMTNGNWQNYVWEIVMLVVIFMYFANFLYGKSKNFRLATAW